MDGSQFDYLARTLASSTSRRQVVRGLVGAITGGFLGALNIRQTVRAGGPAFLTLPFAPDPAMKVVQGWRYNFTPKTCNHCCNPKDLTLHCGIDYIKGTDPNDDATWQTFPVRAAASGKACGNCVSGAGNVVWITHSIGGQTYHTYYGHLASIDRSIPIGSTSRTIDVQQGQIIGMAGDTGTGDPGLVHLHFQVNDATGNKVDPYDLYTTADKYPDPNGTNGLHSGGNSYWTADPPAYASTSPAPCPSGRQCCDNGTPVPSCPRGQTVDKAACQCVCPKNMEFCPSQQRCVPACPAGQVLNPQNCNCGCPQPCTGGKKPNKNCSCACASNQQDCNGTCVDVRRDTKNCGACGHSCNGGTCANGKCQCPAAKGLAKCGTANTCTDITTDPNNCGTCGHACPSGATCQDRQCICPDKTTLCLAELKCVPDCPAGQTLNTTICACTCDNGLTPCGDQCVDTASDANNCGSCGHSCAQGTTCVNRECVSATTGTLVIKALDATTQAPVTDGLFDLSDGTLTTDIGEYFDGPVVPPVGAAPDTIADGQADGVITVADLAPGDYLLRLTGFFPNNGNSRDTHVDTIEYHPVTITAANSTPLTLNFPSPGGSIQTQWVDSSGNPLSAAFLEAIAARNTLRTGNGTWAYFGHQIDSGPTDIYDDFHDLLGPGAYSLDSYYFRNRQETVWIAQNQAVTVELGQTTVVDVVVADYCQANRPCYTDTECCAERSEICLNGTCSAGQPPLPPAATPVA